MYLTLSQAAKETGKSKSTISRYIDKGTLSVAEKNEDGSFKIDPAELFRVFQKRSERGENCSIEQTAIPKRTGGNALEMDILRELADERKANIEQLERKLEKAEERLDQERQEARIEREKLFLLLEHKPAEKADPEPEAPTAQQAPRRRWWNKKPKESKKDSVI